MVKPGAEATPVLRSAPLSSAIYQLARIHRARAGQLLRPLNLHPGQEILLMELSGVEHRTQAELVRTLVVDHSTVAKSLKRMEDAGLVTRRPSDEDRRVTLVSLTGEGDQLVDRIRGVWEELERTTVQGLSARQQRTAVELMTHIERSMRTAVAG